MIENIIISVSGGRSSAFMAKHICTSEKYNDYNKVYVFANTGMERIETIEFLRNMERYWGIEILCVEGVYSNEMGVGVKHQVKSLDTLSMNAEPMEGAIRHKTKGIFHGLPNMKAPYCSSMTKELPIKSFSDDIFGKGNYYMAIGFRAEDMPKRISWAEIEIERYQLYPLLTDFEYPIGQPELNKLWDREPFKLGIHNNLGNCELCWKKSDRKIVEDIRYGTRFIDWFDKMEREYDSTMFRGNKSIHDLIKMSKEPTTGFLNFDESEDDGCVCSF